MVQSLDQKKGKFPNPKYIQVQESVSGDYSQVFEPTNLKVDVNHSSVVEEKRDIFQNISKLADMKQQSLQVDLKTKVGTTQLHSTSGGQEEYSINASRALPMSTSKSHVPFNIFSSDWRWADIDAVVLNEQSTGR